MDGAIQEKRKAMKDRIQFDVTDKETGNVVNFVLDEKECEKLYLEICGFLFDNLLERNKDILVRLKNNVPPPSDNNAVLAKRCAICQHLYDSTKCPLCAVYCSASDCGTDDFDEIAKYKVVCDEFELNQKYEYEQRNSD